MTPSSQQAPRLGELTAGQRVAVCAVLLAAAIRDGDFDQQEEQKIIALLGEELDLDPAQAGDCMAQASARVARTTSPGLLMGDLKYELSLPQKESVLLMLLKVIAADGKQTEEEIAMISQVSEQLKMPAAAVNQVYNQYFVEHQAAN
jgi:uncharacterized tellurite resistance protein B-like protein